ncbi:MAG: competence/damage-inducible protein A [Clostridia bacterium]|nr:competence/damage-inducible protein A [Clostridia bacterium]
MKAEILGVGTELLLGSTINTDAADVATLLSEYGINVYWQSVVGDNPGRVIEAVRIARGRADLIITTGGLGPTCDDLTKVALAEAFGLSMVLNKEEEAWLRGVFASRGRFMEENNLQQAFLPEGAKPLRNDWGTAPGCWFEKDGITVIMLPGPPSECRAMLENRVRPLLKSFADGVILSHNVKFFGIGEGAMEYRLRDYMNSLQNPTLAPYAKEGECLVRVTAKAATPEEAEAMMAPVIEKVKADFRDLVYGVDYDSLAARVMALLEEKGLTLSAAESCTGGELAKRLTDIPGASRHFIGGVTVYTNEAKSKLLDIPADFIKAHGAVSREVAAELAEKVRMKLCTDLGVGITGLAGPEGDGVHEVGTVFVAIAGPDGVFVRETHTASRGRGIVRLYACQNTFDMIRRYLTGLPVTPEETR